MGLIKLSVEEMFMSLKQLLLTTIIITTGIVLTIFALYYAQISEFEQRICDDTLTYGNSRTGYIDVEDFSDEDKMKFYEDVKNIEGINNVGFFYLDEKSSVREVSKIQTKNSLILKELDKFFKAKGKTEVNVMYSLANVCDIKLEDGATIEEPKDDHTVYMYLGNGISEIPIGTQYTKEQFFYDEDGKMVKEDVTYIVKGHMKKGQKWLAEDVYETDGDGDFYYDLHYGVINVRCNTSIYTKSHMFFSINDESDWNSIREKICNIAEKYDNNILLSKLDYVFDKVVKNKKAENKFIFQLAIIVMISVVFIQICIQSSRVINNKTKYAIFFSNGLTPENVIGMLVMENLFKWITSFVVAMGIIFWFLYSQFYDYPEYITRMVECFREFVLWPTIGISLGVMIVGMIFPVVVIGKMAPSKLIKELGE